MFFDNKRQISTKGSEYPTWIYENFELNLHYRSE